MTRSWSGGRPRPGDAWARYRPAGGSWGADQLVLDSPYFDQMQEVMAEFDGTGRAVRPRSITSSTTRSASTCAAPARRGPGAPPTRSSTTTAIRRSPTRRLRDVRNLDTLVRHPQGVVRPGRVEPTRRVPTTTSSCRVSAAPGGTHRRCSISEPSLRRVGGDQRRWRSPGRGYARRRHWPGHLRVDRAVALRGLAGHDEGLAAGRREAVSHAGRGWRRERVLRRVERARRR